MMTRLRKCNRESMKLLIRNSDVLRKLIQGKLLILFILINKLRHILSHSIRLAILHFPKFRGLFNFEFLQSGRRCGVRVVVLLIANTRSL
jgi:hypothetical protein